MGALDGKVALVTGSGRGIGRATVLSLAKHGAMVVVNDIGGEMDGSQRMHSPADDVVKEIEAAGGKAVANYADVSNFQQVQQMIDGTVNQFGHLDIVVNNAGLARRQLIRDMSEEDWDLVLGAHLKSTFNTTHFAIPHMVSRGWGRIVNTLSPAGIMSGSPRRGNYGSAKGGIFAFTNVASVELADTGVTVNCVCPSTSDTRLLRTSIEEVLQGGESAEAEAFIKSIKPTDPAHVATLTTYLCSDAASEITGRFLYSNGGEIQSLQQIQLKPVLTKDGAWELDDLIKAMESAKATL